MIRLPDWQEVAEYLQPERAQFYGVINRNSEQRLKIFDSTPEDALHILAAAEHSLLTNPAHTWFSIKLINGNQDASDEIKEWIEEVKTRMIAKFNNEESGFHTAVHEFYLDLPVFGTAAFLIDEYEGAIRFTCIPLSEITIAENHMGVIDTVYRELDMSARQILQRWPKTAPSCVKEVIEKEPDRRFKILHCIAPREKYSKNPVRGKDMPIASCYIEMTSKEMVEESGYMEMPLLVSRWSKTAGEVYGRGLGQRALPDIRVLNEMNRTALIAAEKQADPTTLLPHEGFISQYASDGGSLNYHRFTGDIREKVMTLGSEADLNAVLAMITQKQESIKRIFLNDKLQMVGGPQMTATEVNATQNEKMRILGPVLGRLQAEFLSPQIKRVFNIMLRNGELPQPPQELQGQEISIQYVSPISRAQKQTEAEAFTQAIQYLSPVVSIKPDIISNFDFDQVARDTQELYGYPSKYLKSPDRIKQEQQAQAEAQQKQQKMAEASQQLQIAGQAKELNAKAEW